MLRQKRKRRAVWHERKKCGIPILLRFRTGSRCWLCMAMHGSGLTDMMRRTSRYWISIFANLLEIGLFIYGDGEIILEETAFPYQAGTLTVIPKNYPHTTNAANHQPNKWEYLFLDIDKLLAEFYPDNRWLSERLAYRIRKCACCTTVQEHPTLALLVRQILKEMQVREEFYRETTMGLLRALVVEMARLNPELIEESGRTEKSRRADTLQITRALEYVGDHYDREIKIGDLAQLCHLVNTFSPDFARCISVHPIDYVNQVRVRMPVGC